MLPLYITFALYLAVMVCIGLRSMESKGCVSHYVLGGRSLGSWVTAFSAQASDMSGWLLMGVPGVVYISGLCNIWVAVGLTVGTLLNWVFISSRLRVYTEITGSLTLSSFFSKRFHERGGMLRILAAFITLMFFTIYAGSGLVAAGKLFDSMFHIDYRAAVLAGSAVILAYTLTGGYQAVCKTDFIQGALMFAALIVVPLVACFHVPAGEFSRAAGERGVSLGLLPEGSGFGPLLAVVSMSAWGIGYFGQPHILTRFMSIRSHRELPKAAKIAMAWVVVSLCMSVAIGLVAIPVYSDPVLSPSDSEKVFIRMSMEFFNPWIAGVLLAAILAAVMSTIDSQLLASSTTLAEDFYKVVLRKRASERELMAVNRSFVAIITAAACVLALNPSETIFSLVTFAWGGFGAAFGPVVVMSLYSRRMTWQAALCGMLAGTAAMLLWYFAGLGKYLYEILPGFAAGVCAIWAVNRMLPQRNARVLAEFDSMLAAVRRGG